MDDDVTQVGCTVRCPKCRSATVGLSEIWNGASIIWEVVDGVRPFRGWTGHPGDPSRVLAECRKCGHEWRTRATQVTDLDGWSPLRERRT